MVMRHSAGGGGGGGVHLCHANHRLTPAPASQLRPALRTPGPRGHQHQGRYCLSVLVGYIVLIQQWVL